MATRKRRVSKKTTGSAIVPFGETGVSDGGDTEWLEKLRQRAQDDAAVSEGADAGWPYINTRGGRAVFQDEELELPVSVAVLGARHDYRLYEGAFDPENPGRPTCFAIGTTASAMAPPADLKTKQAETCEECWANCFGTDNRKKGKACNQRLRLALVSLSKDDTAESVAEAQGARIMVPTMSRRNFHTFANKVTKGAKLPLYAAVAELDVEPNERTQWEVKFRPVGVATNHELLDVLERRADEAKPVLDAPPQIDGPGDDEKPSGGRKAPRRKKVTPPKGEAPGRVKAGAGAGRKKRSRKGF